MSTGGRERKSTFKNSVAAEIDVVTAKRTSRRGAPITRMFRDRLSSHLFGAKVAQKPSQLGQVSHHTDPSYPNCHGLSVIPAWNQKPTDA